MQQSVQSGWVPLPSMRGRYAVASVPARPGRGPPLRALVGAAGRLDRAAVAGRDPAQDRSQQLADRRPSRTRAGADERHLEPDEPDQHAAVGHHAALDAPAAAADEPGPQARGARGRPAQAARRARAADAPARAPARRPARARLAADRALQGRCARRDHGRARVRGLRRPLDPHRVHGARLAPGREGDGHRLRGQGRRDRHRQAAEHAREARGADREADRGRARRGVLDPRRAREPPRHHPERPLDQVRAAARLTRAPPGTPGRRRKAAGPVGQDPGPAGRLLRPDVGRAGQARQRRPDLARQRHAHVTVLRDALLGVLSPGHRHRRARRHADPRRRGRQGRADAGRRLLRRLRQLHVHPARRRALHLLRAPVALRHLDGRQREPGPGDRLRRHDGPFHGQPPALRDAGQRLRGLTR